jgi:hypothetical protein
MTPTSRTLAVTLLAAASLALASPASADPDYHPPDAPCQELLAQAQEWPGTIPLDGGEYRLVSDAFVSHLAGLPNCTATV